MEQEQDSGEVTGRKMTIREAVERYKSFKLQFGSVVVNADTDIYNAIKEYEVVVPFEYE